MRKRLGALLILLSMTVFVAGTYIWNAYLKDAIQERAIEKVVYAFGAKLDEVSLIADRESLAASMAASYGPFVSPKLLAEWQADPAKAPGRDTSGPWPDRIEIEYMDKLTPMRYMITGEIVEVPSSEEAGGDATARRRITLAAEKDGDTWRITHLVLGGSKSELPREPPTRE